MEWVNDKVAQFKLEDQSERLYGQKNPADQNMSRYNYW